MKKREARSFSLILLFSVFLPLNAFIKSERPETLTRAMKQTRDLNIRYCDFAFMDVLGNLKEITLPIERTEGALEKGIFIDGSSVLGYTSINDSDLLLKPDLSGSFLSPWRSSTGQSAFVFCDVHSTPEKPYDHCPRSVLKKALERAKKAGLSFYVGIELEFNLFKKGSDGSITPSDHNIYCDAIHDIELKTFKNAILYALDFAGIDVEKTHHEVAHGQHEVVLRYGNPLLIADSLLLTKHIMQTLAKQNGYEITFMPKPTAKQNGNGMHIHLSMWDIEKNKNLFYDATKPGHLSDTALQFIAGNLAHYKEMTMVLNPTVNSFKRLVPGYEAPVYLSWGYKNRSTAIRIPETNSQEVLENEGASVRMEFRSPDACCNPYLTFASFIHAGLDGVENTLTAPAPVERNLYHATQEDLDTLQVTTIPHSLGESLTEFESSTFMEKVLGGSLHKKLAAIKQTEWRDYSLSEENNPFVVSNWEKKQHRLVL